MASVSGSEGSDGPVLSLITKKLRALKKKYNRIVQLEESQAQGKTLNKEQEDLLKSKLAVSVLIDEYEKLRQPLSAALQEELSRFSSPPPSSPPEDDEQRPNKVEDLEDLLRLLYFGCLFDVKSQSEFMLLTRTHERACCLTYDTVTDDATTDILREGDLDLISALSGLLTSRPVYSGVSHENALEGCIQRAKLWLQKSDEPVFPGTAVTYAGLREKLNKIMASDYFTMIPQMKAPVDVAVVMGKYNSQMQVAEVGSVPTQDELQVAGAPVHYQHKEEEQQDEFQAVEVCLDQSSPLDETEKDESSAQISSGDGITGQQDQEREETDMKHNQRDSEHKEQQQYIPRRSYQNQRGGRGGGGGSRRGYSNGRGGRGGRGGGGGGYQNGRSQQYYDSGYYPRNNYYNTRGRGGGRSSGSAVYNNSNSHGAAVAHGGQVELGTNS